MVHYSVFVYLLRVSMVLFFLSVQLYLSYTFGYVHIGWFPWNSKLNGVINFISFWDTSDFIHWLFQPWLYRRVIDRIVAFWLIFPIALLQKVFRVKFYANGDGFNYMDRTLIIMNHRTRVDWMLFWPLLFHCARLRKLKILLKSDLKYIPGPGW